VQRCRDLLADFQLAALAADTESPPAEIDPGTTLRLVSGEE
jgi:hypothetical protein